MKRVLTTLMMCALLLSACENKIPEEDITESIPLVRQVNVSEGDWGYTDYLSYDKKGMLIGHDLWGSSISYTTKDGKVIATLENGDYMAELTIVDNLCIASTVDAYHGSASPTTQSVINQYSNERLISRKGTMNGEAYEDTFVWQDDNLILWNNGFGYKMSYEYYSYPNPWMNAPFDIISSLFLEDDWDGLPAEMSMGCIGKHSKNLLKASYYDGELYSKFSYDFDSTGRISRIIENHNYWRPRITVYELIY